MLPRGVAGAGSTLGLQVKYTWAKNIDETSSSIFQDFMNSDQFPTMLDYR